MTSANPQKSSRTSPATVKAVQPAAGWGRIAALALPLRRSPAAVATQKVGIWIARSMFWVVYGKAGSPSTAKEFRGEQKESSRRSLPSYFVLLCFCLHVPFQDGRLVQEEGAALHLGLTDDHATQPRPALLRCAPFSSGTVAFPLSRCSFKLEAGSLLGDGGSAYDGNRLEKQRPASRARGPPPSSTHLLPSPPLSLFYLSHPYPSHTPCSPNALT